MIHVLASNADPGIPAWQESFFFTPKGIPVKAGITGNEAIQLKH
jgi:hypothetical protein